MGSNVEDNKKKIIWKYKATFKILYGNKGTFFPKHEKRPYRLQGQLFVPVNGISTQKFAL